MLYSQKEINKFIKGFKNAIVDDRDNYFDYLGVDKDKIDYSYWSEASLDDLKKNILSDEFLINHLINCADSNSGIDITKKYEVDITLLKDEEDFSKNNIFLTLAICFYQSEETYHFRFNWIWELDL